MTKKLLVSDYDGTFHSDLKNLRINQKAVEEFRKKGNLFAISTGRPYDSIKRECKKYDIKYDYLFCNDGAVLFDSNDGIIYAKEFPEDLLLYAGLTISREPNVEEVIYYGAHGKIKAPENLLAQHEEEPIIEIDAKLKFLRSIKQYVQYMQNQYPELGFSKVFRHVFIKEKCDKSIGIDLLLEYLDGEVKAEDVITVGDNRNDLEMLTKYDGYKILTSYPCLYGKGIKTTREVHTLVKKLMR